MNEKLLNPSVKMGGMDKKVSVLIPMYNAGKYIVECIESVKKQEFVKEIIVVNDGSLDDSLHYAQSVDMNPEISLKIIDEKHNGQAATRNILKDRATGDFYFYVDADDVLCDGAVRSLYEAMEEGGADIVCACCKDFISPELSAEDAAKLEIRKDPYPRNLAGCTLFRREAFDLVGDYNEKMTSSETAEWMLRAKNAGLNFVNIDVVTLRRRYHNNNFGRTGRNVQKENYIEIIRQRMGQMRQKP